MAVITKDVGTFWAYDAGGNVTGSFKAQYDYDDALNNRLLTARAINTTDQPGSVTLVRLSDGRVYGPYVIPAQTTVGQPISTNVQNRLELTVLPSGKLNGCDVNLAWPV